MDSLKQIVIKSTVQIPSIDINQIVGHTCAEMPAFKELRYLLPELSGNCYKTLPDGSPHYEKYQQGDENDSANKIITDASGVKQTLHFYEFAPQNYRVDFEYDAKKCVLVASMNIKVFPAKMIDNATGQEVIHDHNAIPKKFSIVARPVTAEILETLKQIESKITSILNKDRYYFTPERCNKKEGCSCKIPFIFKPTLTITSIEPNPYINGEIYLFEKSYRQNSRSWALSNVQVGTKSSEPKMTFDKDGSVIMSPTVMEKVAMLMDGIMSNAHECGHLYGYPDEYYANGGAVHKMYIDPQTRLVDVKKAEPIDDWKRDKNGHLMNSALPNQLPIIPPYYLNEFRKFFEQKTRVEWKIEK